MYCCKRLVHHRRSFRTLNSETYTSELFIFCSRKIENAIKKDNLEGNCFEFLRENLMLFHKGAVKNTVKKVMNTVYSTKIFRV